MKHRIRSLFFSIASILFFGYINCCLFVWLMALDTDRNWNLWLEHRMPYLIRLICIVILYCIYIQVISRYKQIARVPFYIVSTINAIICFPVLCIAISIFIYPSVESPYESLLFATHLAVLTAQILMILCHCNLILYFRKRAHAHEVGIRVSN